MSDDEDRPQKQVPKQAIYFGSLEAQEKSRIEEEQVRRAMGLQAGSVSFFCLFFFFIKQICSLGGSFVCRSERRHPRWKRITFLYIFLYIHMRRVFIHCIFDTIT
jgi:hypothetical protein